MSASAQVDAQLRAPALEEPSPGSLSEVPIQRSQRAPCRYGNDEPSDIIAYWKRLRGLRPFPTRADLDEKIVAFYWPYSVLFRVEGLAGWVEVERAIVPMNALGAGVLRTASGSNSPPFALAEWIISVARAAAAEERPMRETVALPRGATKQRYRGTALPFSDDQRIVDHVLAHYEPIG